MDKNPMDLKIAVKGIDKVYNDGKKSAFKAIDNVSLNVYKNEFVCIVGPSGCGKSTMLRMMAGLDFPTKGIITIDGKKIIGPGDDRGMVFQTYTLFPWLRVEDNIKFGLKLQKFTKAEQEEITYKYLRIIGLEKFAKCYPKELSGGMKQRVAITRALANNPEVLLMDEPFGALDLFTKSQMQLLMRDIWQKEKTTVIFITHDIEEAVFLGTKVYVMTPSPGKIHAEIDIDLPENRDLDLKDTPEFIKIRRSINEMLHPDSSKLK